MDKQQSFTDLEYSNRKKETRREAFLEIMDEINPWDEWKTFVHIDYRINRRPHSLPQVFARAIDWERLIEHNKSSIRCKVEHAFRIIKCQLGYTKTRYWELAKTGNRLYAMFACTNLYVLAMVGRSLRDA